MCIVERIGIYGGSFNPPHTGHLHAARQAVETLGLSRLLMIPTGVAPHKELPADSPTPQQRLEMLRIAVGSDPNLTVSDLEIRQETVSYTCDTVQALRQSHPSAQLILLMGTDMFLSFESWKNPEQILQNAALGVFYRGQPGEEAAVQAQKEKLEAMGAKVYVLENPVTDISSTQLRRMLVFRCADEFLPEGVADYIRAHHLYGTGRNYQNLPEQELEQVVCSLLKPSRVAHVLGCRQAAVELAKRWGANETDAARAALLHDITKALDGQLQLALCRSYGKALDDFSLHYPKTLHALTGSLVAQRIFGENEAVVSAICSHTTGKANMNLLETILYVADYMEPNRDFPGVEELRYLTTVDMNKALQRGLEMTLEHLSQQGEAVSDASREALEYLRAKK